MANGDCPVGARNATRLDRLEQDMAEVRNEQHKQGDCLQQLLTDVAVRKATLDDSAKRTVALIAGAFALAGSLISAGVTIWVASH